MRKADKSGIRKFAEWLSLPEEEREPKTIRALAEQLGKAESTLWLWKAQLTKLDDDEVDRFKRKLYRDAMKPNATGKDKELYARMKGLLVDKQETKVTLELSADERARRELEAERREREWRSREGYRVEVMSEEPALLHNEVRANQ